MDLHDVVTMAVALGRRDFACFPCRRDKSPAVPGGGNGGFYFASTSEPVIRDLWGAYPGPLIGVRTGEASDGRCVLDVDPNGTSWFLENENRLEPTRTFQTPRGTHLWMREPSNTLRCSQSRIATGVDVRAAGGYAIHWAAAGLPVIDHSPEAIWPEWLLELAKPKVTEPGAHPITENEAVAPTSDRYLAYARKVCASLAATEPASKASGTKIHSVKQYGYALGGVMIAAGLSVEAAASMLVDSLPTSGPNAMKDRANAERLARWALARGAAQPLNLAERPYGRAA